MKRCYKCTEIKSLENFYKDRTRSDGLENRCKDCTKSRVISEESRIRGNKRKALYDMTTKGKEGQKRSRDKYRNAYICRCRFNHEVRCNRIINPRVCQQCPSTESVQGHHCDYSKPFDVMWLCRTCHSDWHKRNKPLNREFGIFNRI